MGQARGLVALTRRRQGWARKGMQMGESLSKQTRGHTPTVCPPTEWGDEEERGAITITVNFDQVTPGIALSAAEAKRLKDQIAMLLEAMGASKGP